MTVLSARTRPFIDAFYEDSDPTHLLVLSDALEDKGDKRCSQVRALVRLWKMTEGRSVLADSDDVYAARTRLRERAGLDGVRAWAFLCVRWLPLRSFAEDGRRLWSLLTDARSREGVVAAELAWCGLIDAGELAAKRAAAYDADAAAAYAAYAAAYAADAADAADADAAYAAYAAATAAYAAAAYDAADERQAARRKARQWAVALADALANALPAILKEAQ